MTATRLRWDALPPDWTVTMQPCVGTHPLQRMLTANVVWRNLTVRQQELLLTCYADAPILVRSDVRVRLVARGLIDDAYRVTDAGREVVEWGRT